MKLKEPLVQAAGWLTVPAWAVFLWALDRRARR